MDTLEALGWVRRLKQPMHSVSSIKKLDVKQDIVQFKFDGWWDGLVLQDNKMHYITAGAEVRKLVSVPEAHGQCAVLVGEWMYGTNWSSKYKPGCVIVHDVFAWGEQDLSQDKVPYKERKWFLDQQVLPALASMGINNLISTTDYKIEEAQGLWDAHVADPKTRDHYEGLVFKSSEHLWGQAFYRMKGKYAMDYVLMNVVEGGGRLKGTCGALIGGLYKNGKLTPVCSIGGGMTDTVRAWFWKEKSTLIGTPFEAYGFDVFPGGALRHPQYSRLRPDKLPEQCVEQEVL